MTILKNTKPTIGKVVDALQYLITHNQIDPEAIVTQAHLVDEEPIKDYAPGTLLLMTLDTDGTSGVISVIPEQVTTLM